jgi:1-phosphofructokinase
VPSVITITPAPSIDRTYFISSLQPGSVQRASKVTEELAGKGVNVGHALSLDGIEVSAIVPVPASEHTRWQQRGWIAPVNSTADIRVSITLLEPDGRTTKINQGAPALEESVWANLIEQAATTAQAKECRFLAVCGALPLLSNGNEVDVGEMKELASRLGAKLVLDTSGSQLRRWASEGIPDVIKPNATELAQCVGSSLVTLGDVVDAANKVRSWGVGEVLVSLGVDGLIGLSENFMAFACAEAVPTVSTIGAGDSSLAGYLSHTVKNPADFAGAVGTAVAWGSAKVSQEGSQLSSLANLPSVVVSDEVDLTRELLEPATISTGS